MSAARKAVPAATIPTRGHSRDMGPGGLGALGLTEHAEGPACGLMSSQALQKLALLPGDIQDNLTCLLNTFIFPSFTNIGFFIHQILNSPQGKVRRAVGPQAEVVR